MVNKLRTGRRLKHIDLEVTRVCNLKCAHCSASSKTRGTELSIEQIKEILQQAKNIGLEKLGLTGGEPFLVRDKLKEIGDFSVKELGIPIHIHSNGTVITRQDAHWIRELDAEITIPLYGSIPSIHDKITKIDGSFAQGCRGLSYLLAKQANVCVYMVPMKQNLSNIRPLVKFVREKGVKQVRILALSPTGRAKSKFESIELSDKEKTRLNSDLLRIRKEFDIDLQVGFCTSQNYRGLKIINEHEKCSAAEHRVHIDTFGNIFPCTASSGRAVFSAGNLQLNENSLSSIWRDSPLLQFLRKFHQDPPKKCVNCNRHSNCMSGCRVRMSYKYGDITLADPKCKGPYNNKEVKSGLE